MPLAFFFLLLFHASTFPDYRLLLPANAEARSVASRLDGENRKKRVRTPPAFKEKAMRSA
jgi:hypothetical protein